MKKKAVWLLMSLAVLGQAGPSASQTGSQPPPAGGANVASVRYEVRVLATLKDSAKKELSRNPGRFDPKDVDDVWFYEKNAKGQRQVTSYRLAFPEGAKRTEGYYRIDVFDQGTPQLLPVELGPIPWVKVVRVGQGVAALGGAGDVVEEYTRVVNGDTEVLVRALRQKVHLELLVRHRDKATAEREAGARFKNFYENAQANMLFEEDYYWRWLVLFNDLCDDNYGRIEAIHSALGQLALGRKVRMQAWQGLMQTENAGWPKEGNWFDRFFPAGVFAARDEATLPRLSPLLNLATMKAARDKISREYQELYAGQADLMRQAEALMTAIVDSVQRQWDKARREPGYIRSDRIKQDLEDTLNTWKDKQRLLKVNLYDAAEWYKRHELQQAIEDLELTTKADPKIMKLMQAKVLMARAADWERRVWLQRTSPAYSPEAKASVEEKTARTARLDAIAALHELVTLDPTNKVARAMLAQQEGIVLGWIVGKLEREKQTTLAAFHKYFTQRGYSAGEARGFWAFTETAWVLWSNALSVGLDSLVGTPEAQADGSIKWVNRPELLARAASTEQEMIAANHVSLNLIKRLSRRGLLLKEIRLLSKEELKKHLNLVLVTPPVTRTIGLPDAKVEALRTDMFGTFNELYDLSALSRGAMADFEEYYNRNYYDVFDTDMSWAEYGWNFVLSPGFLLTGFGPRLAVMRTTPQTGLWRHVGFVWPAEAKKYETLRGLVVRRLRLAEANEYLMGTKAAQFFFEGDRVMMQGFLDAGRLGRAGHLEFGARVSSRAMAAIVLYVSLTQIAEEQNMPGLRVMVTCMAELGSSELVHGLLSRAGFAKERAEQLVARYAREVAPQAEQLALVGRQLQEVEELTARLGTAPEGERATLVESIRNHPLLKDVDVTLNLSEARGLNTMEDVWFVTRELAQEVRTVAGPGGPEAARMLKTLRELHARMDARVSQAATQAQRAVALLVGTAETAPTPAGPNFRKLDDVLPEGFFQHRDVYSRGEAGPLLHAGDVHLREGNVEAAAEAYTSGLSRAQRDGDQQLIGLFERRRDFLAESRSNGAVQAALRSAARNRPNPPTHVTNRITEEELAAVLQGRQLSVRNRPFWNEIRRVESPEPTYFLLQDAAGNKWFFKRHVGKTAEERLAHNTADCMAAEMARAAGVPVIACRSVTLPAGFLKDLDGRAIPASNGLLSRFVEGVDAGALTQPQLLSFQREFHELRAFRAFIGCPDGHVGNYRHTADGALLGFDFSYAQITPSRRHRLFADADGRPMLAGDESELIRWMLEYVGARHRQRPANNYGAAVRMDELLGYSNIAPAAPGGPPSVLDRISALCGDQTRLEEAVRQGYRMAENPGDISGTVRVFRERGARPSRDEPSVLERVLQRFFPTLPALPTTFRWLPNSDRAFCNRHAEYPSAA